MIGTNASWRQMLAVQHAPAARIVVLCGGTKPGMRFSGEEKVFDRECSLGELFGWIQEILKRSGVHEAKYEDFPDLPRAAACYGRVG